MSEQAKLQKVNSSSSIQSPVSPNQTKSGYRQLKTSNFFLPPLNQDVNKEDHRDYTLVLDLDETLIHFD